MNSQPSELSERGQRCAMCGEPYDAVRFQVLLFSDLESFDCVECAIEAQRRRRVVRRLKPDLGTVEKLTAELFAVKALLESERRMTAVERERGEVRTAAHGMEEAPGPDLRIG